MILDFGYVCVEMHTFLSEDLKEGQNISARESILQIGGHAGLQSIAAARAGARVSLIGALANDQLSKTISDTLRREGIITSAMAQSEKQTGVNQTIISPNGSKTSFSTMGAHNDIYADQITKTILAPRHLILLHDDVPDEDNMKVIKHAKEHGAKCIMTFNESPSEEILKNLDIAIISSGVGIDENSHSNVIHANSNGFDCFCGTFAACYQAQYTIARSIEYATCAQKLYSESAYVGYAALPYLGDIENIIKQDQT